MEDNKLIPEFNLSSHEIDMVNQDKFVSLKHEWIEANGLSNFVNQEPQSHEEDKLAPTVFGSSPNIIADFDHNQEPIMEALSLASGYAYGVKRQVEKMYTEAYSANSAPEGPENYFADLKKTQNPKLFTRLLGRLASINR